MARRKKEDPPPAGSPAWMATFSDMMTQVLAFFIMLFSFSSINEQKYAAAIASLQGAFGILPSATQVVPSPFMAPGSETMAGQNPSIPISVLEREIKSALREEKGEQLVRVEQRDGSLVLHFDAAALFDSGRAEIKPEAHGILDAVAGVLKKGGNRLRIEGHTDSDPMTPNPQFPDNWALSTGRARMVLLYLSTQHGIKESRLSISGFADTQPVAPNDTPEGKARNRRVDMVILR